MIVKVCGITQEEQAREISSFGATHIGVIHFPKSPRHIDISRIKSIKSSIPDTVKLVAVVVNPDKKDVLKLLEVADVIQFHGEEPLEFLKDFPKEKIFKAFRIKDFSDVEKIEPFSEEGYTILIDAFHREAYGGTGKQIDPFLAKEIIKRYKNIILSGGLSPENVENLIKNLRPYGVDASSKLEVKPGVKDLAKTKEFVQRARKAFSGELVE